MLYRSSNRFPEKISALGFGCMRIPGQETDDKWQFDEDFAIRMFRHAIDSGVNYMDTAYIYSSGQNERILGRALGDGYRDRVLLTTKLPCWLCKEEADFERIFSEQLERLGTDHLDFYLLHSLSGESWKKMNEMHVMDFMEAKKREGRIRHIGFSFHGSYEEFETIARAYPWEICQLQFNYLDVNKQAGEKGIRLAGELGIPVIIMEGLLGGKLANVPANVSDVFRAFPTERSSAEWAFRFLLDRPEIVTVLSGMSDMAQLEDNLRIFSETDVGCMTSEEKELVARAREAYESRLKVSCTSCRYCMPCPAEVDIAGIFSIWNNAAMFDNMEGGKTSYGKRIEKGTDASKCVECLACEGVCPQSLPITELLKKANAELTL